MREKKLTNVRASGSDEKVYLTPARLMTLEDAIGYVAGDELIEVGRRVGGGRVGGWVGGRVGSQRWVGGQADGRVGGAGGLYCC